MQLAVGGAAVIAAVASTRFPLIGTLVAGVATAAAWALGITADPFLLASIGIATIAERRGERRFPMGVVIGGAVLALLTLTVQVGPAIRGQETLWRGLLLGVIVVSGAWAIGVRTRQVKDQAAEQARAVERLRVARDVHDVLSHSLSTIGVQAGVAAHVEALPESQLRSTLQQIETQSRASLQELRALLHDQRSGPGAPGDSSPSLATQLQHTAEAAERSGLRVTLRTSGELARLSREAQAAIHRIAQEATTNAIRHADASELTINVTAADRSVEIRVADNGIGTGTLAEAGTGPHPRGGHGLTGMRERAALLGGALRVDGSDGFVVHATIPVEVLDSPADPADSERGAP